jgi:hypothetical protein
MQRVEGNYRVNLHSWRERRSIRHAGPVGIVFHRLPFQRQCIQGSRPARAAMRLERKIARGRSAMMFPMWLLISLGVVFGLVFVTAHVALRRRSIRDNELLWVQVEYFWLFAAFATLLSGARELWNVCGYRRGASSK